MLVFVGDYTTLVCDSAAGGGCEQQGALLEGAQIAGRLL